MPNLYQLAEQYKKFYEYMENALDSEDLTEDDIQTYYDTLESVQEPFEHKAENVVRFLKNIQGDIEAFKTEKLRMEKKQKYLQNKYDGLKRWLQTSLEMNNIEKINAGMFKVRLQKNPISVSILNENEIPEYYITKKELSFDKKALLDDLKNGKAISGATIAPESKHVRFS